MTDIKNTTGETHLCDVCRAEPSVGVAAVPGIPMSVGYGKMCLEKRASPLWALRANVIIIGGIDLTDPRYLDGCMTYDQETGEYMTLRQALQNHPISQSEIDAVGGGPDL